MRFFIFNLALIGFQLLFSNLERFNHYRELPLDAGLLIYFVISSLIFYAFYLLVPANIAFAVDRGGWGRRLCVAVGLAMAAVLIGFLVVRAGGMGDVTTGGTVMIKDGVPQLPYHIYNVAMTLLSYFSAAGLTGWLRPTRGAEA